MHRIAVPERPGWRARVAELGLVFGDEGGAPYWTDDACWMFTQAEIEALEAATAELHHMALEAAAAAIGRGDGRLGLTPAMAAMAEAAWRAGDPYLYGRFDFAFDGTGPPKLLEYNADTPTSLIEAAVIQWDWMEANRARGAIDAQSDQFNGIEESLVAAWRGLGLHPALQGTLHLAAFHASDEDRQTVAYLAAAATQAGLRPATLDIHDIGHRADLDLFVDVAGLPIEVLFKLYPWEHMAADAFAPVAARRRALFVEPAWKLVLQSKAMLALLWEMFPGHPNLLPASFADDLDGPVVRKPFFSREGANVAVRHPLGPYSLTAETAGAYGREGHVWQALAPLAAAPGGHAIVGSWVSSAQPRFAGIPTFAHGGDPCGIVIREHAGLVTGNASRVVPHLFLPDPADPPVRLPAPVPMLPVLPILAAH
jgi:glutathionylspermidine synthase